MNSKKYGYRREDAKETKRNKKRLQRQDRSAMEDIPIMMDDNLAILQLSESDKMSDIEFPFHYHGRKKENYEI